MRCVPSRITRTLPATQPSVEEGSTEGGPGPAVLALLRAVNFGSSASITRIAPATSCFEGGGGHAAPAVTVGAVDALTALGAVFSAGGAGEQHFFLVFNASCECGTVRYHKKRESASHAFANLFGIFLPFPITKSLTNHTKKFRRSSRGACRPC